jgi:hypothetical protein
MGMKRGFVLLLGLLGGCSQFNSAVTLDAAGAIAKATAQNTPSSLSRIPCYQSISTMTAAPIAGVLDLYETLQEAEDLAKGDCAPVIAGVAIQVLQHSPLVP